MSKSDLVSSILRLTKSCHGSGMTVSDIVAGNMVRTMIRLDHGGYPLDGVTKDGNQIVS
jgi:hypothetical protein